MKVTIEQIMNTYSAELDSIDKKGLRESLEKFRNQQRQPLLDALKQIEQFSDVGSDFLAVTRMKEIASMALEG